MKIQDFDQEHEVSDISGLEAILRTRHASGYNGFWLSHVEMNPCMSILVKDDLAYVHYFQKNREPGFASKGGNVSLNGETTMFRFEMINQEQEIANHMVVPFSAALVAAKEFFRSETLPKSIEWIEL